MFTRTMRAWSVLRSWSSHRFCPWSASSFFRAQNFAHSLPEGFGRLGEIIEAGDGNLEKSLTEITLSFPRGPQPAGEVPLRRRRRRGWNSFVFLNANENEKRTTVLLELVGTKNKGSGCGLDVHLCPVRPKGAADRRQTDFRR